jgi:putative nucleotidyltransferase with HDIG domain
MIHAFRLGPVPSSGTPVNAYVGIAEGGEPRVHLAPGDREGMEALQAEWPGQPIACEEALAGMARAMGLEVAPLPAGLLPARAAIAYELATGVTHGTSRPDAIRAFLEAAATFWGAHTWELVGPEDRLHVLFEEGRAQIQGEVSVLGGDGTRFPGLALCDEPAALPRLAPLEGEGWAAALLELAGLTIDMEREPAWAAEVIGEAYTLPRVPTPQRKRHGRAAAMVTQDLVMAAALLRALAAYSEVEEGGHAEATVEAAGLALRAALGSSAPPATLAAVRQEPAPEPPPEAAPEAAAPEEGSTPAASPAAAVEEPNPAAQPPEPAQRTEPADRPAEPAVQAVELAAPPVEPAVEPVDPAAPPVELAELSAEPAAQAVVESPPEPEEVAAPPAERRLTPALPAPEPPPSPPPAALEPAPARPGLLARAWGALRGGGGVAPKDAPRRRAAKRQVAAPARPAAPRPRPAPDTPAAPLPDHPFAALARAVKVELPDDPRPPPAEEVAPQAQLAAKLQETAAAAAELVAFPAVALQIVELVHAPRADAAGVAGFISRDPALAADVVRVANSAAFRGVSEVDSVRDAVARLGLEEVGRVASAVAARKLLDPAGGAADKARRTTALFTRAVAVATAASAAALRLRGARSDHVWLGGLLHDVGRALALQALAQLTAKGTDHLTSVAVADRALDQVHVEVGAAALGRWALPEWLQAIAARHHDAEVPAGPEQLDLHLVRLTSALAWLGDPSAGARASREVLQSAAALGFGVPAVRALATDLREAEQRAQLLAR